MPLRNRVDPWGDLHAVPQRGTFTGNRGCLVDDRGKVVRHHQGNLWITCRLEYQGWRHPLNEPRVWTPLFFLDEAVALAAGHRPCAQCRRDDYLAYRDAIARVEGWKHPPSAVDLNRRLAAERLSPGRGVERASNRKSWTADLSDLPIGTVVLHEDHRPRLVTATEVLAFSFDGWTDPRPRPIGVSVQVLTPRTSVSALSGGYHAS